MITPDQCLAKYGEPAPAFERKWMAVYGVNGYTSQLHALPRKIYMNKDMWIPLDEAFRNLIKFGLQDELKTWDGCFNIRPQRGSSVPSIHSWGVAVDVNAAWNGLGKVPTLSPLFVRAFKMAGFDWGGDWKGKRIDGMHFQLQVI